YANTTFTFTDVVITNPFQGLAVVLKANAATAAQAQSMSSLTGLANGTAERWSTDSGGTWQPALSLLDQYDLPFSVYGVYRTKAQSQVNTTHYYVTRVRVRATIGQGPDARLMATAAPLLSRPEVPGP